MITNQIVDTPLGKGTVQAPRYVIRDGDGAEITTAVLVRLPINEQTEKAKKQSNCITPTAQHSGLWVFQEEQLSAVSR